MSYCTILTCPELYFDNVGVNCILALGVIVTVVLVIRGIFRFLVKTFFN